MTDIEYNLDVPTDIAKAQKVLAPAVKRLTKALIALDPNKVPVGMLADYLYDLEQLKKLVNILAEPFIDALDPAIKRIEEHFVNTLAAGAASGVQGARSRVQITPAVIPIVDNWEKFYAHIKRTGEFELLNRKVNSKAVVERWDLKKQVPGIGRFTKKNVSCTKLARGGKIVIMKKKEKMA